MYVSTSITPHIQRRINSSLNQSERLSLKLKPKVQKRTGTLFVASYTTLHSQHAAKNNERTLTGTMRTSLLMELVIDAKRSALINFKRDQSERNKTALRAARNKAQQTARHCANNYWLQLCQSIQTSSDTGNIRSMYDVIKKATVPTITKTAPLKTKSGEVITDSNKQMERWVEHYLELYSKENAITDKALDTIESLPVMTELDTEPTEDDLSKAIDSLKNGKAPGKDDIPPEVTKHGKPALLHHLHVLLLLCWKEGTVHRDMRDANIVTLYKNKGDRSDCNNYRGISLLIVVGKVFARVALTELQILAECTFPEYVASEREDPQ